MRHFDNFTNSLKVLSRAKKENALNDDIYRMGVIGQYNLTFELAWKAIKEILQLHGVINFKTGSPREILKEAYAINFLNDSEIWLEMLNSRNSIVHIYDENAAIELSNKIFDNYIAAFKNLRELLAEKISAADEDTFERKF